VDKPSFLHKLKDLAAFRCLAQALYQACMEGEQILLSVQEGRFCTFAPVDMHGFVHTRFTPTLALLRRRGWQLATGQAVKSEVGIQQIAPRRKKIFCNRASFRF
jgi:hypothetical protein